MLFVVVETIARLWRRTRLLGIVLVPLAVAAAGVWWRSMADLGVFLHAEWGISYIAPAVYVAMFTGYAIASGIALTHRVHHPGSSRYGHRVRQLR